MVAARPLGIHVCKFGGTSVANADCLRRAYSIIRSQSGPCVAIVSAMGGVTNRLIDSADRAVEGNLDSALATAGFLRKSHEDLIDDLLCTPEAEALRHVLKQHVNQSVQEFLNICQSLAVLRERTPRILDVIVARGERLLAQIFARGLESSGCAADYVDATEVLFVAHGPGLGVEGSDSPKSRAALEVKVIPALNRGQVIVIPGFIASGPRGEVITLGRGGSDYSATLIAELLGAQEVTLYKEVDGLLTADPNLVADARVINELHYREATELAFYGAKVLHPRTIIPLMKQRIPLTIRNSFRPEFAGTRISADAPAGVFPVKALTAIAGQVLITVQGNGMMGVPGIAGRTFTSLAQAGVSTAFISQASSESSICFVVPEKESDQAMQVLQQTFRLEREHGLIDDILCQRGVALVAVVGQGMRGHPGVAARTMRAISESGANIIAIAQGSSELNISVAIDERDSKAVLRALHREYRLHEMTARPEQRDHQANVVVFGFGQIGRAFVSQITEQHEYLSQALHLDFRFTGVFDSKQIYFKETGFTTAEMVVLREAKRSSQSFESLTISGAKSLHNIEDVLASRSVKGIFVDCTAAESYSQVLAAVGASWHVVLANKKPLAVNQSDYDKLFSLAADRGVLIRYEATVGAGLPVLDTIAKLRAAGDQILEIEGCLSGTIGYLVTQISQGELFSHAVRKAVQAGLTEPDPREDLSGMDVARKALILARTLGLRMELQDIEVEALFPAELWGSQYSKPEEFVAALEKSDETMRHRVEAAAADSCVLRYIARISTQPEQCKIRVKLQPVAVGSAMGRLVGTENQVLIRSKRYKDNPLVVTGPGAGAEVTAAGVLGDVLAIGQSESLSALSVVRR